MAYKDLEKKKAKQAEMYQKNKEHRKAQNAKWREENKEKQQLYLKQWREDNKEEQKLKNAKYYQNIKEEKKEYQKTYKENIISCAISMITAQIINDPHIWNLYCNNMRRSANTKNKPYTENFTDDMIFDKMKYGCVYCGDIATTLDRLDSNLNHTPDNCVGCCRPCNISKGNCDPDTFLRKAFYRARGEYIDEVVNIWSDNISKPNFYAAKITSQKQDREFLLTREEWDVLVDGNCVYCQRSKPNGKWNGVDRVIPDNGYTSKNTVSCCDDCNIDKWELDEDTMKKRNEKIANRLQNGEITLFGCEINLRHTGINATKVCVYGKLYPSYVSASRALEYNDDYISDCFYKKRHMEYIFKISDEFYEEYKDSTEYITKEMFNTFQTM